MYAFLRRQLEEKCISLQLETTPAEPAISMNISPKFLKVLQLSFEVKYMDEDITLTEKRDKIKTIEERMGVLLYHNVIQRDVPTDPKFDDIVALATAYYNVGLKYGIYTDTDDLSNAVQCFSRCVDILKEKISDRKAILTSIGALNELYSVHEKMDKKTDSALNTLNRALKIYMTYTQEENYPDPICIASFVGIKEEESNPKIILNTLHHTTLQNLRLQYLIRPIDKHLFVHYLNKELNTRLTDIVSNETKFDEKCLDMALTLFELSRYFLANGRFTEAKSHIAIGDYVIFRLTAELLKAEEKERRGKKGKKACYAIAVNAKSWGSYGVSLLRFWMEQFSQNKGNHKSSEIQDLMSTLEIKSEKSNLIFSDLLEKELEGMNIQFTETCILNLADAKSVFIKTLRQFEKAKEHFTPDTDTVTYANIILEISDTYKYLAGFEEQRDNQIKLHKRRVKLLEDAGKKFPTIIKDDTELQIYKRIWYEVVTSCSMVMDLMVEKTYYDGLFKEVSTKADQYMKMLAENSGFYLNTV
ncbi:KIF1-binding protein homolog [Temnothorax curvispinosus]|uniref:KIF-binding protein n=1 Tax=Temnothorax curvispinosus TaxID=300111 RepID=A0A6J1QXI8_9HYME|nr:KIF1-binding protein homolog [Temnothorax curvispinosus]